MDENIKFHEIFREEHKNGDQSSALHLLLLERQSK
jgi:hypothetical protein